MVPIDDVLGLDSQALVVTVGAEPGAALPLAAEYQGVGRFGPVEFDNVTGVTGLPMPNRLLYELGIADGITVRSTGVYPETITVTAIEVVGEISEQGRAPATAEASVTGNAEFTRSTACVEGAQSCSYTLSGAGLDSLSLNWSGVAAIVFGGAEPNSATATVTVSFASEPALVPGSTVEFILVVESTRAGL